MTERGALVVVAVLLSGDRVLVLSDAGNLPRAEQVLTGSG